MLLCCSLECAFCNAKNISYGGWKWKKLSYGKITGNFEGHFSIHHTQLWKDAVLHDQQQLGKLVKLEANMGQMTLETKVSGTCVYKGNQLTVMIRAGLCHTSHPSRFCDTFSTHIG